MRIYRSLFLWAITLNYSPLRAEERCEWNTWQEMAKSAVESSPEILALKSEESYKLSQSNTANLGPTSVANAQYVAGGMPWKSSNFEGSYLWTIERSQKRDARIAAARVGVENLQFERDDRVAQTILKIALIQQALKTMDSRIEILAETKETYRKVIKQYESRLSLGPEQEASLAVFTIAKKENDLRIEAMEVDRDQFTNQLNRTLGCRLRKLPKLPQTKLESPQEGPIDSASPALRKLNADSKSFELSARSDMESYRSDFSVGPMIIAERKDDENRLQVGLVASYPIEGSRPATLSSMKSAEIRANQSQVDLKINQIEFERESWHSQYTKSLRALKGGLTVEELSKAHRKLERLFQGERVSAALIIESHRQLLDHITSVTNLESKATEALWNLRYLDGKISWRDL
ncbi:MAG: hypothetical protein EOP10_09185 [Proteobacteria bacterium]|nr:MAG: hypothetical protein EOP10_09185 [Pseudomonadota bacterium]